MIICFLVEIISANSFLATSSNNTGQGSLWVFHSERVSKNASIIIRQLWGRGQVWLMIQTPQQHSVLRGQNVWKCYSHNNPFSANDVSIESFSEPTINSDSFSATNKIDDSFSDPENSFFASNKKTLSESDVSQKSISKTTDNSLLTKTKKTFFLASYKISMFLNENIFKYIFPTVTERKSARYNSEGVFISSFSTIKENLPQQQQQHTQVSPLAAGTSGFPDYASITEIDAFNLPQEIAINDGVTSSASQSGTFYFSIFNCDNPLGYNRILFSFHNSWGYLSFGKYPVIFIGWIEAGSYLILLIIVSVNSLRHIRLRILLHYLIVGTIAVSLASTAVSAALYLIANRQGPSGQSTQALDIASSVLVCIKNFCLMMLSLFLASGISIVHDRLRCEVALGIVAVSAVFATAEFLVESTFEFSFGINAIVFLLFIVMYCIHGFMLMRLSRQALQTLSAHMVMIQSVRIDPKSTPTYRKKKLLKFTRKCAIAILLLFVISSILFRVGLFHFFITYLIIASTTAILLSIIAWNCRLRYNMAATYGDGEEMYAINDDNSNDGGGDNINKNFDNNNNSNNNYNYNYDGNAYSNNNPYDNYNNCANYNNDNNNYNNNNCYNNSLNGEEKGKKGKKKKGKDDSDSSKKNKSHDVENMVEWEYGMLLPPMPSDNYAQNQVHPTD